MLALRSGVRGPSSFLPSWNFGLTARAAALLGCHVAAVGPGVTETFLTVGTLKRFLARMNSRVLLQVVLELECFTAFLTAKLPHLGCFLMADHVTLEAVDVCEGFPADMASL